MPMSPSMVGVINPPRVKTSPVAFVPTAQTHFVRKTGSDANGGSSLSVIQSGTDGVTNGTTFSSATASFGGGDVNELIMLTGIGRYRIVAVTDANTITLSAPAPASTGITWKEGGTCLTISALLSAGNEAVREGDTIYIGAGTYRELITVAVATHNAGSVSVVGDTDGVQTGDAGMVLVTAWLTNDSTAPAGGAVLTLNAMSGLSFSRIIFVGSGATNQRTIDATTQMSHGIVFRDCAFSSLGQVAAGVIAATGANGVPFGWVIDRCRFLCLNNQTALQWLFSGGDSPDYDLGIAITNALILGGSTGVQHARTGAARGAAGGLVVRNSTISVSPNSGTAIALTNGSATVKAQVFNCIMISAGGNSISGGSTLVTEDYNLAIATTNTSLSGAHTISDGSRAPLFHFGQEVAWGGFLRPFGEPMSGSPLAGFGNDGSQTTYDTLNRPRPAGGGNSLPAVGALERGNSFAKETGTVHTGANAISAIGAAYQDFLLPVSSGVTYTPSIYSNRDGSYTGTNPQISVLNGTECGVADQTVTAGGSASSWVQISLASFVPTANGIVTIRLLANDTSGVAKTCFDTFAAT